jgi:SAM-dependent methyltransferase
MAISQSEKLGLLKSVEFRKLLAFELDCHDEIIRSSSRRERGQVYSRVYPEWSTLMTCFLKTLPSYGDGLGFNPVFVKWFAPWLRSRRVLEIGCGGGLATERLKSLSGTLTGLDIDAGLLGMAMERCPEVNFVHANLVERLPFAEGSFDAIYWNDVAEHLHPEDLDTCLSEVRRVLSPNGHLCTVTCHLDDGPHDSSLAILPRGRQPLGMHMQEFTYTVWNLLLRKHGLIGRQSIVGVSVLTKLGLLPTMAASMMRFGPVNIVENRWLSRSSKLVGWAFGTNSICSVATRAN